MDMAPAASRFSAHTHHLPSSPFQQPPELFQLEALGECIRREKTPHQEQN
jgi:hypothetical protein